MKGMSMIGTRFDAASHDGALLHETLGNPWLWLLGTVLVVFAMRVDANVLNDVTMADAARPCAAVNRM